MMKKILFSLLFFLLLGLCVSVCILVSFVVTSEEKTYNAPQVSQQHSDKTISEITDETNDIEEAGDESSNDSFNLSQQYDEEEITDPIKASDKEPLQSFENYLKDFMNSYSLDNRESFEKLDSGWVKIHYFPLSEYKYDVSATNSLVSPYIGLVEFNLVVSVSESHNTKEEAENDQDFPGVEVIKHSNKYAFQDGKWVLTVANAYDSVFDQWFDCAEGGLYGGCK